MLVKVQPGDLLIQIQVKKYASVLTMTRRMLVGMEITAGILMCVLFVTNFMQSQTMKKTQTVSRGKI